MGLFWKKPTFLILLLLLLVVSIPLTVYFFKPQILSGLIYISTKIKNQQSPKPGTCLILEERYCSQVKLIKQQLPTGQTVKIVAINLPAKTPLFLPKDGQVAKTQLNDKVAFFKGSRAVVFDPNNPNNSRYIFTGDIQFDNMLSLNMKGGETFGHSQNTGIEMLGYNFLFYIADIGPDKKEIIHENEMQRLFPSIKP